MYFIVKRFFLGLLLALSYFALYAQPVITAPPTQSVDLNPEFRPSDTRPRSTVWPALASYFLPGFDQYWEGQTKYALSYSAVGAGGIALMSEHKVRNYKATKSWLETSQDNPNVGYQLLGVKLYDTAGSLSAYHSFKTAVRTRKHEFAFIEKEESVQDLLRAPIRFSELTKPTVFIPLGVLAGLSLLAPKGKKGENGNHATGLDRAVWTSGLSYGAGVGEEALFRGWVMPNLHAATQSPWGSNVIQGVLFGALHYSEANPIPIAQTLLGVYFGWRTQTTGYSLQESIFIHFWWDAIVFARSYFYVQDAQAAYLMPIFSATL